MGAARVEEHLAPLRVEVEAGGAISVTIGLAGGLLYVCDPEGEMMYAFAPLEEELGEEGLLRERLDQLQLGGTREAKLHPAKTVAQVIGPLKELTAQESHQR
jgi:hypothetical protein